MSSKLSLPKSERLSSEKDIETLFKKGRVIRIFPFKIFWMVTPAQPGSGAKILISVPKRSFKKATDRNLLKRRIREAYRLHKSILTPSVEKKTNCLLLGLVYIAPAPLPFIEIEQKIILVLQRLRVDYEQARA